MSLPANFNVSDAMDDAFESIGIAPENITGQHIRSARRSIRRMLAAWNSDKVMFWKVVSGQTQAVTINTSVFSPAVGTVSILRMACRRSSLDTPMLEIAASDWFAIPDKLEAIGMPNRFWQERLATIINAHWWPIAENSTDILVYDAMMYFNDSGIMAASADVPDRWIDAFVSGLAYYLAEKFAPTRLQEKKLIYGGPMVMTGAYATAKMGDRETNDTVLSIQRHRRQRR